MPSISRVPSEALVVGAICGSCWHEMDTATHAPDFCGMCRARFDKGQPLAVVYLDVALTGPIGVELEPVTLIDYRGAWTAEGKDALERDFYSAGD